MNQVKCQTFSMSERLALIKNLVERFKQEEARYTSPQFNESSCRSLLIDPLLEAFGWDVQNEAGNRIDYRTVKVESPVVIEGMPKRTDYELCIITKPMIVLEAKKPHVNIKTDPFPAIQARRYARTRGTPIAIVTNFKEMAIYDASVKLNPTTDKSTTALIEYLTYNEYEAKFEELYNHISYDAVLNGNFSEWAGDKESRKGAESVDDEFLAMIEKWREILAEDIALHNEISDDYDLTSPVQKIIDRIIFLRIAEGKGIEPFGVLRDACHATVIASEAKQSHKINEENEIATTASGLAMTGHSEIAMKSVQTSRDDGTVYKNLNALFFKANEKYNAGLFAEDAETENLCVQDKTLQAIIFELYEPYCHYEFAVLPIEILGSVYERFLGKVVHFSRKTKSGHSIKVEEKPEVAKAGGVYYTPNYIVEYIVQQTIGEAIKEKTPEDVSKMHFLDPACGSGSFLVGAYKFLLDWHLAYYTQNEIRRKKALKEFRIYETAFQTKGVNYKLSVHEKKRILTNNIFGVDIDAQAVEVTKLSLFLKLLDDETAASEELFKSSEISQEKILPNMSANIKCGNSLIGSDFWADAQGELFDDKKYFRSINTFDWEKEFPFLVNSDERTLSSEAYRNGSDTGFDCVIGNPPYVNISVHPDYYEYLSSHYSEIHTGYNDLMYYFLYRGLSLLKETGFYGVIVSNYFLWNDYAKKLRAFLGDKVTSIVNFNKAHIFTKANVHTLLLFAQKKDLPKNISIFIYKGEKPQKKIVLNDEYDATTLERKTLGDTWIIASDEDSEKIQKMQKNTIPLGEIMEIEKGTSTGKNDVFTVKREFAEARNFEKELLHPNVKNGDIQKYIFTDRGTVLIYVDGETDIKKYPNIKQYLTEHKKELSARNEVVQKKYAWYRLERPRNKAIFDAKEKLVVPYRAEHNRFAYDDKQCFNDGGDIRALVVKKNAPFDIFYLLAVLNSSIVDWYYGVAGKSKGTLREYFNKPLAEIPIPSASKETQEKISTMARRLIALYSQKQDDTTKKQIAILEAQVDKAVEVLYGAECVVRSV